MESNAKEVVIRFRIHLQINFITIRIAFAALKENQIINDFTEHLYYGKRSDKMIKGTSRQKSTKKKASLFSIFDFIKRQLYF